MSELKVNLKLYPEWVQDDIRTQLADTMEDYNRMREQLAASQAEVERLRQEIVNASYQANTRLEIAREYYARIIELEGKLARTQIERNDARSEVKRLRGIIREASNASEKYAGQLFHKCCDSWANEEHEPACPFYQWEGGAQ